MSFKHISNYNNFPSFERDPNDDEYMKDGLIYCKNCNTPRQERFDDNGKILVFPIECSCKQKEREERDKIEYEAARRRVIDDRRRIGISNSKYRTYTFDKDNGLSPMITHICKKYVENFNEMAKFGGGLLFWGEVGTGKTFFAMCIANALIDKGVRAKCTSLTQIVQNAQDFNNAEAHFNRLIESDLIIIDDLGTERDTSFANEQIFKFIDACNTRDVPMIFTTNINPSTLDRVIKDLTFSRVYSRILEKCQPIPVVGVKQRKDSGASIQDKIKALLTN